MKKQSITYIPEAPYSPASHSTSLSDYYPSSDRIGRLFPDFALYVIEPDMGSFVNWICRILSVGFTHMAACSYRSFIFIAVQNSFMKNFCVFLFFGNLSGYSLRLL